MSKIILSVRDDREMRQEHVLGLLQQARSGLKGDEFSSVRRGLDGLRESNRILVNRNAVGVLIGGLAKAVWEEGATTETLARHKDVDVMVVPSPGFDTQRNQFGGGIDWWFPTQDEVSSPYPDGSTKTLSYWSNVNGVVLRFGIDQCDHTLHPGLYIPDRTWIAKMRTAEACASLDMSSVEDGEIDGVVGDAIQIMKDTFRNSIGQSLIADVSRICGRRILIGEDKVGVREFDHRTVVAIQNRR